MKPLQKTTHLKRKCEPDPTYPRFKTLDRFKRESERGEERGGETR